MRFSFAGRRLSTSGRDISASQRQSKLIECDHDHAVKKAASGEFIPDSEIQALVGWIDVPRDRWTCHDGFVGEEMMMEDVR